MAGESLVGVGHTENGSGTAKDSRSAAALMVCHILSVHEHQYAENELKRENLTEVFGSWRWADTGVQWQLVPPCFHQVLGFTLTTVQILRWCNIQKQTRVAEVDKRRYTTPRNEFDSLDAEYADWIGTYLMMRNCPERCGCCTDWDALRRSLLRPDVAE